MDTKQENLIYNSDQIEFSWKFGSNNTYGIGDRNGEFTLRNGDYEMWASPIMVI